ncbi:MAG: hypothetical protein JJE03_06075 [Peptostreptococcaceae bacterium]|nr:hypothetical protein [Peptostreptococcaceae bacterium]
MKNIKELIWMLFLIIVAIVIMLIGGTSRLAVLGGEDILAVIIASYAVINYLDQTENGGSHDRRNV